MSRIGLILYRYRIERGAILSFKEQQALLEQAQDARPVAYRKREPSGSDFDTFLMQPKSWFVGGHRVLTWHVVKQLTERSVKRADRKNDVIVHDIQPTDEVQTAKVYAIPLIGCAAVEDRSGVEFLPAGSALARFKTIVETLDDSLDVSFSEAGTAADMQRAIATWDIHEFKFEARPFNPHPSNPGEILSDPSARATPLHP